MAWRSCWTDDDEILKVFRIQDVPPHIWIMCAKAIIHTDYIHTCFGGWLEVVQCEAVNFLSTSFQLLDMLVRSTMTALTVTWLWFDSSLAVCSHNFILTQSVIFSVFKLLLNRHSTHIR